MSTERKKGQIWSFNPEKVIGSIIQDDTNQRFFFHGSSVRFGAGEMTITAKVLFLVDPKQPAPRKLSIARGIEILEDVKDPSSEDIQVGHGDDGEVKS